jgi:general stress protein 26
MTSSYSDYSEAELQQRLWKEIAKARYGMLGVVGHTPVQHFQPMTAFAEEDNGQIWFFTQTETDLARAVEHGAPAMFIVQAKDQGFQACIGGRLIHHPDRIRIDKYWNPVVSAWYPDGKEDTRLTLLRFDLTDAQVWISETNPLAFAFQIAKANMTHERPDVGDSATVNLTGAGSPS